MEQSMFRNKHIYSTQQSVHAWFARQLGDLKPKGATASLDGVRGLAFLIVLCQHVSSMAAILGFWSPGANPFLAAFLLSGSSGVTLFFVLSGFLLFLPYAQAFVLKKSWPEAKIFYLRRVLRIFPGYFFSLFILVFFSKPFLLQPHNWHQLLPFLTFTMQFGSSALINGPYWTLAVEFQYYLLLPLIAFAIYGLTRLVRPERRIRVVVVCLLAMIVWGLATRALGDHSTLHPNEHFGLPPRIFSVFIQIVYGNYGKFFEDFAAGMLIALGYIYVLNSPQKEQYLRRLHQVGPLLCVISVLCFAFAIMRNYAEAYLHFWSFVPSFFLRFPWITEFTFAIGYSCFVLAVLFNRSGGWIKRIFEWTPLRWIGLISYSLYIWHLPILLAIAANLGPSLKHFSHPLSFFLFWFLVFTVSVFCCFFLYILIEKPGMQLSERLRQQILQRRAPTQSASVSPQISLQSDFERLDEETEKRPVVRPSYADASPLSEVRQNS
jgi:peptidoglycan/LPS O-acetylase OafA/YrhL